MPDFGDPYAAANTAFPANPYLQLQMPTIEKPHWSTVVGNMLMGAGAGISQADASGRGWLSGVAPGLMYGTQLLGQQQKQQEAEQLKRLQMGIALQGLHDKRTEAARKQAAIEQAAREYERPTPAPGPGFNLQPNPIQMAPGSYDARTAGLEGGTKNGGMIFNELGSGAFGPYQFMPATWADVAAKNPNLGLPADMTKATREQHDAAHNAFKAGNAQALQAAGFQPTPENLYLAHRFGVGGALSVLRAEPNKPLAEVLPVDWQRQNPDMRGQTVGGFRRLAAERMQGVGVPYEAPQNAKPTQYALQPDALPSFEEDSTLSLLPRGTSRFMPGVLPNTDSAPSMTAPVMPQPQMTVQPVQYTPPSPTPQAGSPAAPSADGAPKLVLPPKPELPAEDAVRIRRAILSGAMTPEQGRSEGARIVGDLWSALKTEAQTRFQQDSENYRHRRGLDVEDQRHKRNLDVEGDWVRTSPDGPEVFVPKSQRSPGQARYDKPKDAPEPGTEPGDYRVLTDGANSGKIDTREYAAAYNRIKSKTIDIGNGQKLPPDMRAFPEPTFAEATERPAPTPIGERERKFTESESKNHVYATQLNNAIPRLEALVKDESGKYTTKNLPGNLGQAAARQDWYPESLVGEKAKQFRELEMAILTGTLRPASGATILPSEFVSERAKYIPQPNDTPEQIERKLNALKAVASAIAEGTGRERQQYPNLFKQDEPKASPIRIDMSGKRK